MAVLARTAGHSRGGQTVSMPLGASVLDTHGEPGENTGGVNGLSGESPAGF
ncbi:hypothetical protein [Paenibacillus chitinolyticus]